MKTRTKLLLTGFISALVGGALVFVALKSDFGFAARPQSPIERMLGAHDDFFRDFDQAFAEMRKLREQSRFDDDFFGASVGVDIAQREDERYVIYEIPLESVEGSSVKTRVADGYLTITGEAKKKEIKAGAQTFFQSSFERSFPLPEYVDPEKMEMDTGKDKLVLKFPKREGRADS